MNRVFAFLFALWLPLSASATQSEICHYGEACRIPFTLHDHTDPTDPELTTAVAIVTGDIYWTCILSGTSTQDNTTILTGDVTEIGGYSFELELGATETDCERIKIDIIDAAGDVWFPKTITITTVGNASAGVEGILTSVPNNLSTSDNIGINLSDVNGTLDAAEIGADAITAAKIAADAIGASEIATNALGDAEVANDALGQNPPTNWDDLSITVTTGRVAVESIGGTIQTGNDNGADINAVLDDTSNMQPKFGAITGTGQNTLLGYIQSLARNDVVVSSDIGGTYDDAQESLEALRARGDAAWTTGGGTGLNGVTGTTQTAVHTATSIVLASGAVANDKDFKGWTFQVTSGNCAQQKAVVKDSFRTSDTIELHPGLLIDASGTCTNINNDLDGVSYELAPY